MFFNQVEGGTGLIFCSRSEETVSINADEVLHHVSFPEIPSQKHSEIGSENPPSPFRFKGGFFRHPTGRLCPFDLSGHLIYLLSLILERQAETPLNNRQQLTPLFTRLKEHAARNPLQFHIPGHKKGQGMDPEFRDFMGERALSIDLINIAPLDDLHHPHGPIQEAQKLAAEAFGADHTFFSVQGTSGAIMTMVLSVCSPGDKIIVPRNVHKSVLTAIILAGGHPVFVHPVMDEQLGIAHENGLIADEDVQAPSADRLREAARAIGAAYPADDVTLYLSTLMWQDPETWAGLAELPELAQHA